MVCRRALTIPLCVVLLAQMGCGFVAATRAQPISVSLWQEEADARIKTVRTGDLVIEVRDEDGKPVTGATVSLRQLSHDFWFGTALASGAATIAPRYKETVRSLFNAAVHENALKWYSTERTQGLVNYRDADDWVKWCEENGLRVRGHCIFWENPERNLQWVRDLDRDSLRRAVERRAREVTTRYRGRITEYDVNNEMIQHDFFQSRLGAYIVDDMFRWAKEGDPNATLYLNEYLGTSASLLPRYEKMIKSLLERRVLVGGIGVQAHFGEGADRTRPPTMDEWNGVLNRLSVFGLPIKITEYSYDTANEERKASFLSDFYRLCFSHPAVEGILMWGFWEGAIWRPGAAILNRDFSPRPAAEAYRKLVYDEWWTKAAGRTDVAGKFNTRAFFGRYTVTATTPDGRAANETFPFPKKTQQPMRVTVTVKPPQSYYAARDSLARARELKTQAASSNFTSQDARTLAEQASENLESAEKAFSERRSEAALALAQQAVTLFEKALALEHQEKSRQSIYVLSSGAALFVIAASAALVLYRKRKPQQTS